MTFVKLIEEGVLKAVISQNCDGLHRRSGLPIKSKSSVRTAQEVWSAHQSVRTVVACTGGVVCPSIVSHQSEL
jgi:NAD-dependent SIR2 family protein deacetylase